MYTTLRPLLFRLDAERAHELTLRALRLAGTSVAARRLLWRLFEYADPRLAVEAFGLQFRNPVGLAAGYDKNGVAVRGLACLGFGHLEVGTVTVRPQPGNPRPRVRRVVAARAVVNSMGFPNAGAAALPPNLPALAASAVPPGAAVPRVGVNLGKGKDTPLEAAAEDYCALLRHVHAHGQADYVAINVSSPNTLGLRQLQARAAIEQLLASVARARDALSPRLPLLVKIAPDLSPAEIEDVLGAIEAAGLDGLIATNTTTSRDGVPEAAGWPGGVSGQPLRARATAVIRHAARATGGRLPIIGVGGIMSPADAVEKIRAGAWLVQVYTGLVYTGPGLAREINRELARLCRVEGVDNPRQLHRVSLP